MVAIRIFGTAINVKPTVLLPLITLWGGVTWWGLRRHPERGFWKGGLIGLASAAVLAAADLGHPIGHIFSARLARAPMDEVHLSLGMPRTLYWNNAVSPDAHRLRAIGGPIFNALVFLISVAIYRAAPRSSIARELAAWSAVGHGLLVPMSLFPLPMVDGGALLKWTLVARGRSEREADEFVRRVDWGLGILGGIVSVGFIAREIAARRGVVETFLPRRTAE